jgi:hypothetical protein
VSVEVFFNARQPVLVLRQISSVLRLDFCGVLQGVFDFMNLSSGVMLIDILIESIVDCQSTPDKTCVSNHAFVAPPPGLGARGAGPATPRPSSIYIPPLQFRHQTRILGLIRGRAPNSRPGPLKNALREFGAHP